MFDEGVEAFAHGFGEVFEGFVLESSLTADDLAGEGFGFGKGGVRHWFVVVEDGYQALVVAGLESLVEGSRWL